MTAPPELPPPMVPPEVDLRDFSFMPLDCLRLRDSDLAAVATGDEFRAAVLLWCAAWHQVPAASLTDDDRSLARFAQSANWQKVKAQALRGFVRCSDGRLYHPVIAQKACEAWGAKVRQRERTRAATAAREAKRKPAGPPDVEHHGDAQHERRDEERDVGRDEERDEDRDVVQGTGTGTGTGTQKRSNTVAPTRRVDAKPTPPTTEVWQAYEVAYAARYGATPVRNAKVSGQLANLVRRIGADAPEVARYFVGLDERLYVVGMHPVDLLLRDAEKLRTMWATGRKASPAPVEAEPEWRRLERERNEAFMGHASASAGRAREAARKAREAAGEVVDVLAAEVPSLPGFPSEFEGLE